MKQVAEDDEEGQEGHHLKGGQGPIRDFRFRADALGDKQGPEGVKAVNAMASVSPRATRIMKRRFSAMASRPKVTKKWRN